jgi:Restriction endonuclease
MGEETVHLPHLWIGPGDWQSYEAYVTGALSRRFSNARVIADVHIIGAKSGVSRQIDILVERSRPIAVDCKCYRRKVDVKQVETFLGMLDDIGIDIGILVTTRGYTKAALARAKNDHRSIDLQILSPTRLSEYQHVGAPLIWRGTLGIFLDCPKGWTTDSELSGGPGRWLVAMYPLGYTLESAAGDANFIYADILTKSDAEPTIEAIARRHEAGIRSMDAAATVGYSTFSVTDENGIERQALLRTATYSTLGSGREHSLYVDYGTYGLLIVALSRAGEAENMIALVREVAKNSFVLKVEDKRVRNLSPAAREHT